MNMLIYDWYDGPVGGLVLVNSQTCCFQMVDWDSSHRFRIMGIQGISKSLENLIPSLTDEQPKWPVWFPAALIEPSDESRTWVKSVLAIRCHPEILDGVFVWETVCEQALSIRHLKPDLAAHVMPWFDAVDSAEGQIDWFGALSLPRA